MSENFPEIIGVMFAVALIAILLIASVARSPLIVPAAAAVVGYVVFLRMRSAKRKA